MKNLHIYDIFYSLASSFPKISLRPHSAPSAPEPERKLKGNSVWRGWRKEHRLSVQPNYSRSSGSKRTAYLLRTFPCLDSWVSDSFEHDEIQFKVEKKISRLPVRWRISWPQPSRRPICRCRRSWRGKTLHFLWRKNTFCAGCGWLTKLFSNEMQARLISSLASCKFSSPSDIVELSDELSDELSEL